MFKLENVAIANALQLEATRTQYITLRRDTDLWPLEFHLWPFTLNICNYCIWRDETLYQTRAQSSNPRRSYCDFNVWPYDLEHCIMHCARLSHNFHQVWPSTTCTCLNYSVFDADTLCHAVTLTFDPLTLKVRGTSSVTWSKSVRNSSEIKKSPVELLIILRIFAHVMSRCDFALWPLDLELLQHIALFDPPVKSRGGMGEIFIPIVAALPATKPPKNIWRPSTVRLLSTVDW